MSAFQLDTSGIVWRPDFAPSEAGGEWVKSTDTCWSWADLTPFAQGYVEAMFRHLPHAFQMGSGKIISVGYSNLAPATLQRIIGDCERMISRGITDAALKNPDDKGGTFWRLRQAKVYPSFPPLTPYLGDDGLIYFLEDGQ